MRKVSVFTTLRKIILPKNWRFQPVKAYCQNKCVKFVKLICKCEKTLYLYSIINN